MNSFSFYNFSIYNFQTSVPVPSPKSGIVEEYLVEDGQTVTAGTPLFKLKITGKNYHDNT